MVDALDRAGESAVLQGGLVSRLSAPATLIRASSTEWTSVEELAGILVDAFGEPPDAASVQVTRAWVDELTSAGLLEVDESEPEGVLDT